MLPRLWPLLKFWKFHQISKIPKPKCISGILCNFDFLNQERLVHTDCGNGNGNSNISSIKNGLHWTLWKCLHGDLHQRQRQPIGFNTIHSFRCRCRSQCERAWTPTHPPTITTKNEITPDLARRKLGPQKIFFQIFCSSFWCDTMLLSILLVI